MCRCIHDYCVWDVQFGGHVVVYEYLRKLVVVLARGSVNGGNIGGRHLEHVNISTHKHLQNVKGIIMRGGMNGI